MSLDNPADASEFLLPDGSIDIFSLSKKAQKLFAGNRVRFTAALPSEAVLFQTRGLYDVVHLLAYCADFVGDMVTIERTVITLLTDLGWDPQLPRVGVVLNISGCDAFITAMSQCAINHRIPCHGIRLSKDNGLAHEQLDHLLKQCTHAVEFTSRRVATQCFTQQSHFYSMAYAHGLSYLKFVLTE